MSISSVAWLCACPTPFLIAQVKILRQYIPRVDLVFFDDLSKHPERLNHWNVDQELTLSPSAFVHQIPRYQFVISGLPISNLRTYKVLFLCRKFSTLILYNEIPLPLHPKPLNTLKTFIYITLLKLIQPRAIFGIGTVASHYYSKISPAGCFVAPLPYFVESVDYLNLNRTISEERASTTLSFRFLFSGQLIKRNNLFTLIDAFNILLSKGISNIELVIYGSGPLEDKIRSYIDDLSLNDSVFVLSEPPRSWADRLIPIMQSNCLVSVPNYSGWGLTIPEALLLRKPVISTTSALSAHNYIVSGVNGILLSKYTTEELASAMLDVFTNNIKFHFPEVVLSGDAFAQTFISLLTICSQCHQ